MTIAGPFEVLSVCGLRKVKEKPFNVYTVAQQEVVTARKQSRVILYYMMDNCPIPDILLLPGGGGILPDDTPFGSRREMNDGPLLDWIRGENKTAEIFLSVCTCSLLLEKTGLLEGLSATTHWKAMDAMRAAAPSTTILPEERWVDNGRIILSVGISAGPDMSLYVMSKLLGKEAADETAKYMHYKH